MDEGTQQEDFSRGMVFVIMPFAEQYDEVYTRVIKPTVSSLGFECIRADEIAKPGNINKDIVDRISRADFIIADLTDSNPNVMYELGLCHAMDRVTIMISQNTNNLPFDIRTYRVIDYKQTISGGEHLTKELTRFITNEESKVEISNPVSDFHGRPPAQSVGEQLRNPVECFNSLCRFMETMKDHVAPDENIKLLRAMPTEMSERIFKRYVGDTSIDIRKYETLIREYVDRPDLDDETIFGCPPTLQCLEETLSIIKSSYFTYPKTKTSKSLKEVSALGFHPYLKGYALFLLGKMKKVHDEPKRFHTGFIFFLNKQGIPSDGVRVSDAQSVRVLQHIWKMILDEITHAPEGINLKRFQTIIISTKNHGQLFLKHIGKTMA
ncbi:hypothetical protein MJD09_17390, partial [bacterium]|nr:hypothetical protein [bacterium]